jgi:hypothetical protein
MLTTGTILCGLAVLTAAFQATATAAVFGALGFWFISHKHRQVKINLHKIRYLAFDYPHVHQKAARSDPEYHGTHPPARA